MTSSELVDVIISVIRSHSKVLGRHEVLGDTVESTTLPSSGGLGLLLTRHGPIFPFAFHLHS